MESDIALARLAVRIPVQVWKKRLHMLYCSDFLTQRQVKFRAFTEELAWRNGCSQLLSWPMNCKVYALPMLSHRQSAGNHCNTVLIQQKKLLFHWKCSGRHKCNVACCYPLRCLQLLRIAEVVVFFLSTQMSSRRNIAPQRLLYSSEAK